MEKVVRKLSLPNTPTPNTPKTQDTTKRSVSTPTERKVLIDCQGNDYHIQFTFSQSYQRVSSGCSSVLSEERHH